MLDLNYTKPQVRALPDKDKQHYTWEWVESVCFITYWQYECEEREISHTEILQSLMDIQLTQINNINFYADVDIVNLSKLYDSCFYAASEI